MNQLLDLFLTFFKIGLFTFGGGYAMLPMVEDEVIRRNWMTMSELVNFTAVSESTPGPFAVNVATFIGAHTAGFAGAVCATLGVVLPSFLIILIISKGYQKFRDSHVVKGIMSGLRPAVVGLIGDAAVSVGANVFIGSASEPAVSAGQFWMSLIIFAGASYLVIRKKIHPILVILIAAGIGIAMGLAGLL